MSMFKKGFVFLWIFFISEVTNSNLHEAGFSYIMSNGANVNMFVIDVDTEYH